MASRSIMLVVSEESSRQPSSTLMRDDKCFLLLSLFGGGEHPVVLYAFSPLSPPLHQSLIVQ